MHLRGRTIKQCLFLIMVPHRSPINTSRWLQSCQASNYWQKFLRSSLSNAFSSDSVLSSLSQSILYWQTFLLIFATIMVPHWSPTNTSRREQISSTSFRDLSKQCRSLWLHSFQSFPKHRNWQKLLLILATIMVPHRSPTTGRSCFLILVTIKQCLFLWLFLWSLYRLPKCTSEDGPSSNAFSS